MAETYFEGTRWLMLRASEQKFSHFDHDDADGVAVYAVVNPEYMEWRQLDGIGDRCMAVLKSDDRFIYLGQLPAEWYALRDAIVITGRWPDDGSWMKADNLDLLESHWEALDE